MKMSCISFGSQARLMAMIFLTSSFFLVEIIMGYLSNSMALVADSFHMLSDIIALFVAYVAVRVSPKDWSRNTFGYARAEVLGALINSVFLMALCFTIFVEAVKRCIIKEEVKNPFLVLIVGIVGLCVNLLGLVLFKDSHGHSHGGEKDKKSKEPPHGHSHGHTHGHSHASGAQMNIRGVFLHVLADALGSVIVIISASIIYYVDWEYNVYIDPILSLLLVVLIMFSTWPLFKDSALILLQTVPEHLEVKNIKDEILKEVPEVKEIHEFHVWNLVGSRIVASLHITLDQEKADHMGVSRKIKELFHKQGIHSTTIQLEYSRDLTSDTKSEAESISSGGSNREDHFINIEDENRDNTSHNSCTLLCPTSPSKQSNYPDVLAEVNDCTPATCCGPRNRKKNKPEENITEKTGKDAGPMTKEVLKNREEALKKVESSAL